MGKLPDGWEDYLPIGQRVAGTPFIPFKVPLKQEICIKVPENSRFTPSILIEKLPALRTIIDLTDTARYYNPREFTSKGMEHKKINIPGRKLPPLSKLNSFYRVVDEFLEKYASDPDALLGVHCTHGLNRTGYMICKYMVERMKIDPKEAISKFEKARGYPIEREIYTDNVCKVERTSVSPRVKQIRPNVQTRPRIHHRNQFYNVPRNNARNGPHNSWGYNNTNGPDNSSRYNGNQNVPFNGYRRPERSSSDRSYPRRDNYKDNDSFQNAHRQPVPISRNNYYHQSPLDNSDYNETNYHPRRYYANRTYRPNIQ